jgi:hypothetical protein
MRHFMVMLPLDIISGLWVLIMFCTADLLRLFCALKFLKIL